MQQRFRRGDAGFEVVTSERKRATCRAAWLIDVLVIACGIQSTFEELRPWMAEGEACNDPALDQCKRQRTKHPGVARVLEIVTNDVAMAFGYLPRHQHRTTCL